MKKGLIIKKLDNGKLNNISLEVEEGTLVALLGKSGSGKTTLLKSIAGLIESNNSITFNDHSLTLNECLPKEIGIYLGFINLSCDTVFNNLMEILINLEYKIDNAHKKVYDISKKIGIDNILYKKISELSYGEKRVVSLAKTIIKEPKLLLLDNPFESLDTYYKKKIVKYLISLKETKKSIIIFTTNDEEDILLSDKILVMSDGKLIKYDSKEKLLESENVFIKNEISLPFIIDLSHKLQSYEILDKLMYSIDEMVDVLWK